jgi:NAD(P)-dependent dehydrogenase (short-subunit alcohol dehydrogenase family)
MNLKDFAKRIFGPGGKTPIVVNVNHTSQQQNFENKRALVIGGGTGIGLAISRKLSESGCEVIVASRNHHADCNLKVEIWDVSEISSIEQKFAEIVRKYGQIDIVVNSQGICPKVDFKQDLNNIDYVDFENVIKINCESVYFICKCTCKYFEENEIHGHILNIASTEGLKGAIVPYGLSKAMVISLTKGFGKKMINKNIVVNGIAPGATATNMMGMEENQNVELSRVPSGRATLPQEIAEAALLLISDIGNQMCGEILVMDGGESLH